MDLILTEDQRLIREEARRLLSEKADSTRLRQTVEAGTGFDASLWATIAGELGWCAMTVPEDEGGLGLGLTELVLLMEAAGERLAPVPLWSTTCLALPLLMAIGSGAAQAEWLARIAAGEVAATVALGRGGFGADVTATRHGDGYLLNGRIAQVIDADAADVILVPALVEGEAACFLLRRGAGQGVRILQTLDSTRQVGELTMADLALPAAARIDSGACAAADIDRALATAALGLAAEQVGAARGVMDLTLAYVGERVQFGRTIASFQAVKHRCALLEVDLAEARALVYGAAAAAGDTDPQDWLMEIAGVLTLASDLFCLAAEEAIQLHGGVGFTWEYDPHFYFKRAQASRSLLGDPGEQLDRIAAHVLDRENAA